MYNWDLSCSKLTLEDQWDQWVLGSYIQNQAHRLNPSIVQRGLTECFQQIYNKHVLEQKDEISLIQAHKFIEKSLDNSHIFDYHVK